MQYDHSHKHLLAEVFKTTSIKLPATLSKIETASSKMFNNSFLTVFCMLVYMTSLLLSETSNIPCFNKTNIMLFFHCYCLMCKTYQMSETGVLSSMPNYY